MVQSTPSTISEVVVERLIIGGLGLAWHDGRTILIPYAAPGDRLLVEIKAEKRRGVHHGRIDTIVTAGPDRIEPVCPLYGRCGGCQLQHLSQEAALSVKRSFVIDALRRLARVAAVDAENCVWPTQPVQPVVGYRQRAQLHIYQHGHKTAVGFHAPNSHRVIDTNHCAILCPQLNQLLPPIHQAIADLDRPLRLSHIDLACGESGLLLALHGRAPLTPPALQPFVTGDNCLYRVNGVELSFRAGNFTQANFVGNQHLVAKVLEQAGSGHQALDLFCGIGNFTLPLRQQFDRVTGWDLCPSSIDLARQNIVNNGLSDIAIGHADLFSPAGVTQLALDESALSKTDCVVLDPPREGAALISQRLASPNRIKRVVYVSCNPATFARDTAVLVAGGWRLHSVHPIDMFPLTHHIELVALFVRS
ncbi:MAG: methyltransferase domain-containing protein [Magnetococcales bacterium]|nr:methyltransferase domain-containing protein [Magnetococcales bacterium]